MKKQRLKNLTIFLILLATEAIIALYVHDKIIRPFVGDAIVVIAIYYLARAIFPTGIKLLPLYIFLFAASIEILQLLNITDMISANSKFLSTILGSTFSVGDIICYAAGCVILIPIEKQNRRQK